MDKVFLKANCVKVALGFLSLILFASCNQQPASVIPTNTNRAPLDGNVKRGAKPEPDSQVGVIETDFGTIVIELYPNIAPQMVARFKQLTQEGFYDGTTFHRVNSAAGLIQGGDPLSKDGDPDNDGSGDSSHSNVPAEFSDIPFEKGTVGAARRGASPEFAGRAEVTEAQARDTANCQFFITLRPTPQLDEEYTVFGKVIVGMSTAETIMGAPVRGETEQPAEKIVIKKIKLEPRSKYVAN